MEQKKIPFKGINRCFDDGISQDGYCMELINARIRNGSIEPIPAPVHIADLPSDAEKVYYHTIAKRVLIISTDRSVSAYSETYQQQQVLSNELTGTNHIEFVGNVAIFFLEDTTKYCIFKEGLYVFLGEKPEVPSLRCENHGKLFSFKSDTKYIVEPSSSDEFYGSVEYATTGLYDNVIDTANKEGYLLRGYMLYVATFRLFDGSNLSYSLINISEDEFQILDEGEDLVQDNGVTSREHPLGRSFHWKDGNWAKVTVFARCYKPNFYFGTGFTNLGPWKDIITAIDIYALPIYNARKEEIKNDKFGITYSAYKFHYTEEEWIKMFSEASVFYKVAEYNLQGKQTWTIDKPSKDNLALQERLSFNGLNGISTADISYVYNNRLHIAKYKSRLNDKYRFTSGGFNLTGKEYEQRYYFYINTNEGDKVVMVKSNVWSNFSIPYIMYYNNKASKCLAVIYDEENAKWRGREFNLTKHSSLDVSFYIHITDGPTNCLVEQKPYKKIGSGFDLLSCDYVDTLPDISNVYEQKGNILKVSALSNPFVFPEAQTYQPSNADIVGVCSNTQALSQGQFGQHPLYVFTRDGIYAMSVDASGSIVYTAITPVSRDVCINTSSIKGIDSSVLFATSRGLMAIAGGTVTKLSTDIEGYLPSCLDSSPLIPKIASIAGMNDKLSTTEFHNFIDSGSNLRIAYNYASNEIIVSNTAYPYSYIYNTQSQTWSKVDYTIYYVTNSYPDCHAIHLRTDGTRHLINPYNPHRTIAKTLLITKPIKMGTDAHKRILQSALRALVHPAKSDLCFRGEPVLFRGDNVDIFSDIGLYILGSNDAEHFELLSGKEAIRDVRDLVTKMTKSKACKYFIVALAGGVRTDVAINYIEFLVDDAYTNRLR